MQATYRIGLVFGYGIYPDGTLLPQLKARCDVAVTEHKNRPFQFICIATSYAENGHRMEESMREYMVSQGIPRYRIECLGYGLNTAGEIDTFCASLKRIRGPVADNTEIVAISSWYHLPRILFLLRTRLGFYNTISIAGTWAHTHWSDIVLEPLKFANSFLRPFKSSKKSKDK